MRIGNNSQGIWQLLSRMNGGKTNMNTPFAGARRSSAGGKNTLEDQLTGHRKNSYGVEGMCVTNNPNARKIIKVSDEMKQRVFNSVKDAYYKYNGMSGDNEAEWEEMAQAKNNYYKTLKKEDRGSRIMDITAVRNKHWEKGSQCSERKSTRMDCRKTRFT